jgi:hypothetical protein
MQIQSNSSYQAQAILGAWQAGDTERLREELDRVRGAGYEPFDSGEAERLELLSEIARELRALNQPFSGDSSQICCDLLQHLALSGTRAGGRRSATLPLQRGPVAKAAVLQ